MLGAGEVLRVVVRAKAQTTVFVLGVRNAGGQGKGCEVLSGLKPRLRVLSTVSEMPGAGEGLPGVARAKLNRPQAASVDSGGA